MRRVLLPVFAVLAALILQLTVLDRLPLPGGVAPDLVLLVVVALALSNGPMAGLVTGFCAGLALDIAPPASHLIGLYALVFCLVGYFCGLVSAGLENSVLLPLGASALGAAGGAALYAAAGVMLGNPDVSGQAVRHVLPLSVVYDVLLSPFVLYAVALASRLAARLAGVMTSPGDPAAAGAGLAGRNRPGLAGRLVRPGWLARPDHSLRVPAAGPREGWIAGGGWLAASAELARNRPAAVRLHLGSRGRTGLLESARSAGGALPASAPVKATPRLRFGSGRHGDAVPGGLLGRGLTGGGTAGLAGITGGRFSSRFSGGSGGRFSGFSGRGSSPSRGRFGRSWASGGQGGRSWASASGVTAAGGSAPALGGRSPVSGGRVPRKGTFSGSSRPGAYSGGTPRPGTLSAGPARRGWIGSSGRRMPLAGALPRKPHFSGGPARVTNFSGGSSGGSSSAAGGRAPASAGRAPRRGTFNGSSRRGPLPGSSQRGSLASSSVSGGRASAAGGRAQASAGRALRRGAFGSGRRNPFGHAKPRRKSPRRGSLGGSPVSAAWPGRRRRLFGLPLPGRAGSGWFGGKRTGGWR